MQNISNIIVYVFSFLSLYFEIFLLITYIEKRKSIGEKADSEELNYFPTTTIMVPCFNEEKTLEKTVNSLLNLDYPKDKIEIFIVDDGSTDGTYEVAKKFSNNPQIKIFKKENGGKHTVLNFGIKNSRSELIGCLDADSFVDKYALKRIVYFFNKDKNTMAVVPAIKIHEPKNIIQKIQNVEYNLGVFKRKVLSLLDALYVTPGPFSIFRREVFETLGYYKHAHLTEDFEMAMRMQASHYKIDNSHKSFVYTVAPNSLKKLYKQRLRWTYGFIKNAIDYRFMFFKKEYGNMSFFLLPTAIFSIISAIYLVTVFIVEMIGKISDKILEIQVVGFKFDLSKWNFDPFYLNTETISILALMAGILSIYIILISQKIADDKVKIKLDLVYFLIVYPFIAPIWLFKAVYNTVLSKKTLWR
ncbi:MAG: glycosyltransferase [bacterium]|nr:glycosyltransferase [bacterium]